MICQCCKKELPVSKKRNKFCNHSCAATYNNAGVVRNFKNGSCSEKDCTICGKLTFNKLFCSKECEGEHRRNLVIERIKSGEYALTWSGNPVLRNFLITERGYCCEGCDNEEWMGEPIPLSVHHIDGDASNNKPENLQLLCLNCHGLTDNYGRKNKEGKRKYRYAPKV